MKKYNRLPTMVKCEISGKEIPIADAIPVDLVRDSLIPYLHQMCPDQELDPNGYVSRESLALARKQVVNAWAAEEEGEMQRLRMQVADAVESHDTIAKNVDSEYNLKTTFGDKIADKLAAVAGSWTFILSFLAFLGVWMGINTKALLNHPPDPFPYIFLNLILSCIAALQAPVIMMSQNRQDTRDRIRNEVDYMVNLKAELEIKFLNEKVDRLIHDHWKHLLEIQQMQMEMIEELLEQKNKPEA
jgi:uncharacterized membrane protein